MKQDTLVAGSLALIFACISYNLNLSWLRQDIFVYVTTLEGTLQGFKSIARDGRDFFEFRGIPYAQPPLGELRFEPPIRHSKWNGTRSALSYGSKCLQYELFVEMALGDEDCLFLNVYTPKLSLGSKFNNETKIQLPVLVFFHGGMFMFGNTNDYKPHYIMDEDVVLVTVNYRLASFGFLNTGDGLINGNMGLKDQVMALEWIRDNIQYFCGNPKLVTIFGESAGAASVHYHMLSPMSKGLFHRAISMSGTALGHWAFNPKPREQAERLGKRVKCPTHSSEALVKCLKALSAYIINDSHEEYLLAPVLRERLAIFVPTVEIINSNNTKVFLSDTPLNIIKSVGAVNKVPFINGVNSHEGIIFALGVIRDSTTVVEINQEWTKSAPKLFDYEDASDIDTQTNVSLQLKNYYFKENTLGRHTFYQMSDIFSDISFYDGLKKTTLFNYNKSINSYLYFNSHHGSFGLGQLYLHKSGFLPHLLDIGYSIATRWFKSDILGWKEHYYGVCHGDEIGLLFKFDFFSNLQRGDKEYGMSKALVKSWTQFAKTGRPPKFKGVEWPPALVDENKPLQYMLISDKPAVIDEPFSERLEFWNELKNKVK